MCVCVCVRDRRNAKEKLELTFYKKVSLEIHLRERIRRELDLIDAQNDFLDQNSRGLHWKENYFADRKKIKLKLF